MIFYFLIHINIYYIIKIKLLIEFFYNGVKSVIFLFSSFIFGNFIFKWQISKLVEIARAVANVNNCDYSALEYMLDRLEDLKYAIQDRKVDALIVETFGRRIEKLLQWAPVTFLFDLRQTLIFFIRFRKFL